MRTIVERVALEYGVTVAELLGPRRTRQLVVARQEAMLRISEAHPHASPREIGEALNRHRCTVIQGIKRARGRRG